MANYNKLPEDRLYLQFRRRMPVNPTEPAVTFGGPGVEWTPIFIYIYIGDLTYTNEDL